jgi:mannitol-1-/sugar-/sorbitol-6-phosphatase
MIGDFKGILFDNEGTLIDASEATRNCWSTLAAWYDLPTEELLALVPGRPARDVLCHYSARLPVPVDDALQRYLRLAANYDTGIQPVPGALQLLTDLPTELWAVVTSGTRDFALRRITAAGLPEPSHIVTADDVSAGKPDPEPYMAAAGLLGVRPSDCVAIDDSPAGIESASHARCSTVAVLTTHRRSELSGADAYVNDLNQVRISLEDHKVHVKVFADTQ